MLPRPGEFAGDTAGVVDVLPCSTRARCRGLSHAMAVAQRQCDGLARRAGLGGGLARRTLVWLVPGLLCGVVRRSRASGWSGSVERRAVRCCCGVLAQHVGEGGPHAQDQDQEGTTRGW